jgi:hypothetical protein
VSFLIVCSGPSRTSGQFQNACSRAGLVSPDGTAATDDYGMPGMIDGSEPSEPQGFLSVAADDMTSVESVVDAYGWSVRACRSTDTEGESLGSPNARLEALEARVAVLEGGIHGS